MDPVPTSEFDWQFELEDPFELIAALIIETFRNEALQDALVRLNAPKEPTPAAEAEPTGSDRLLTLKEASAYLKLPPSTVRDLCKRKKLNYARINYRNWRFRLADLDAYLAKRTARAK